MGKTIGDFTRPETQDAMDLIRDTFSGGDGGGAFVLFSRLVGTLDERAAQGDQAAIEVLNSVIRTGRLIKIACKDIA